MNTNNAEKSTQIKYQIGVVNGSRSITTRNEVHRNTESFKIVDGNIRIHDQATVSPQLHGDRYTTPGITIDRLEGNINSTLVVTKNNSDEIITTRNISKDTLRTNEAISIDTSLLGGDFIGYLFANSTIKSTDDPFKNGLSSNMTDLALSTDKGRMVMADLNASSMSYNSSGVNKIEISDVKVSDAINEGTPYVVTLYPINSTGYMLQNKPIASSRVRTGRSNCLNLYFNTTSHKSSISRSNRYAAAIQLAHGYSSGELISPEKAELLRNSDLNDQFVTDGVAKYGVIRINESLRTNLSVSDTGIRIYHNKSLDRVVYSGQLINYNSSTDGSEVELHRISGNQSRVVSVGTRLSNSSKIGFNTSNIASGEYRIKSDKGSSKTFEIIGSGAKHMSLRNIPNRVANGDHIRSLVYHSVSSLSLNLNNTASNATITLNLTTTDTGPTPITINTYASPESPSEFVSTGPDISVESITGDLDSVSPGTYDVTLRSKHGTAVANDTATVRVTPRSTGDLSAYTTREAVPGEFENATAIRDAVENGTLSEATTAGPNDTMVYGVNATGLTGLPVAANASLDRGADLARLDGLSFGVRRTNASEATTATEEDALGPVPSDSTVHLDREGLFLVTDGETAFGTETPPADGETFEAGFSVDDERLNRTDDPATTRLTYVADAPDEPATNGSANGSDTARSTESPPTDSGGSAGTGTAAGSGTTDDSGGTGSADGSGVSGASGASGGSVASGGPGASGASGGASAPAGGGSGSDAGASVSNGSGQGGATGSRGSGGDRETAPPGTGITVAPGTSEIPPSAGPPALFGGDGTTDGERPAAREPGSETGRASDGGGSDGGSEAATGEAESVDTGERGDADDNPASDLGYDEAPIRSTMYDLPGFGPVGSLAAVASAALLARRRL
ncbi:MULTISPECIES: hypothetical protein [Halorubrum]|uniref:hypothetical protein n=1 Tax=Halorubrum TaxID=56688 RepID=UPI002AA2B0FF|nr:MULTISPECIES: hypothetical protein [Halorubrum]